MSEKECKHPGWERFCDDCFADMATTVARLEKEKIKVEARCSDLQEKYSDYHEVNKANGNLAEKCAELTEKVAGLAAALEKYARRYEDGKCWNWLKWACDKFSGQQSHFDWVGEEQQEPYEVAEKALKDASPILARVRAEAKTEALRNAGDWFKAWKDMPASYERAGEALHRMADEATATLKKEAGKP